MALTNETFVVDKWPPFCYNTGRKVVALLMENWVLPEINLLLCNRCGTCVEQCPTDAVEMGLEGAFIARQADCTYCALCDAICLQNAITCVYEIIWGEEINENKSIEKE